MDCPARDSGAGGTGRQCHTSAAFSTWVSMLYFLQHGPAEDPRRDVGGLAMDTAGSAAPALLNSKNVAERSR